MTLTTANIEKKGYQGIQGSWYWHFHLVSNYSYLTPVSAFDQFDVQLNFFVHFFWFSFAPFFFPFLVCPFTRFLDPLAFFRPIFLIFLILLQIFFISFIDIARSLQYFINKQQYSGGKFLKIVQVLFQNICKISHRTTEISLTYMWCQKK